MATLLLQGHSANQNAGTTKMLPPSGKAGHSPNELYKQPLGAALFY